MTEEHMKLNPDFFESVEDQPLHLIFKVQKPDVPKVTSGSYLESPRMWNNLQRQNLNSIIDLAMPKTVLHELISAAEGQIASDATDYCRSGFQLSCDALLEGLNISKLPLSRNFAIGVREKIAKYGACCVKNSNFSSAWENDYIDSEHKETNFPGYDGTAIAKICYLILSSLIGTVDDNARGALFDVQYKVPTSQEVNVLVSNTNDDSGWHTDGASFDRRYGIVGLQCIKPASTEGGEFMISHSGNALHDMKAKLPQFLLYELERPVMHDVLENGRGLGKESFSNGQMMGNSPRVIAQRIKMNSYPIYDHFDSSDGSFAFRYMRAWTTRAYERAVMPMSPLLEIAMDCLDQALDHNTAFKRGLDTGEICYVNNLLVAHRRTAFGNDKERHMVIVRFGEECEE